MKIDENANECCRKVMNFWYVLPSTRHKIVNDILAEIHILDILEEIH